MSLVDRDNILDFIKDELKQDRPDEIHIRNIIRFLEDLPSAFDVEKVVEQLKISSRPWNLHEQFIMLNNAIKIVKEGIKDGKGVETVERS